ncbi:MAG: hypothetical protein ACLPY2_12795 [Bryobacteraceae bacterium]|jgi:hypothetical protein
MHRDPFVCTDEVAVDAATLAAIGRGIKDADQRPHRFHRSSP